MTTRLGTAMCPLIFSLMALWFVSKHSENDEARNAPSMPTREWAADDTPDHLKGFQKIASSPQRGELLFHSDRLVCSQCHSTTRGEDSFGPNLFEVGSRLSRYQIIESILYPSRKLAKGHESVSVVLSDGRILTGRSAVKSADELTITFTTYDGAIEDFPVDDVDEVTRGVSDMPTGTVDGLTPPEFADLLAYLHSRKPLP